jgi:signal transduction histidine kinase
VATAANLYSMPATAKKYFLLFRWLIIIVCSLMIVGSETLLVGRALEYVLVGALILSNLILYFVPESQFQRSSLSSSVGIADIFVITAALVISGQTASDFYMTYFLVIIISALSRNLVRIVISATLVILIYGLLLLLNSESGVPESPILLRLPFFFVIALFYGHLVLWVRKAEKQKEQSLDLVAEIRKESQEQMEANTRLNRLLEEQSALREILTQINVLDMNELLQKVAQQSLHLLRIDDVHIRLLTDDGFLKPVAAAGSQTERLTERAQKADVGRAGWVIRNLRPLAIPDIEQDKEFGQGHIMREEGIRSYLGLPLVARGGQPVGVLIGQSRAPRVFATEDIRLAEQFATGAAIAIENARLFEEVQKKTRELEEAYEAKSDFLNMMAHELKTPLNVILGNTQLIKDGYYGAVGAGVGKGLETTQRNAQSLLKLINEILDLARLEARRVPVRIEEFSLRKLLDELQSSFTPLVREKGLDLKFDADETDLALNTDRDKLHTILQNLIGNAVKYTDQGRVELAVSRDHNAHALKIVVRDTGIGIRSEELGRIFEPFQMVDGLDREKYPGSGLGLSLVQRLVQLLNGEIKVQSEPGQGSTFTVMLPLGDPQAGAVAG